MATDLYRYEKVGADILAEALLVVDEAEVAILEAQGYYNKKSH